LEQQDLEEAREMARSAAGELRQLSLQLRDEEERRWEGMKAPVRRAREKVEESEPLARQIADELDQVMPQPGQMLSPQDRQRLENLAGRQEAIRRRADEARREFERRRHGDHAEPQGSEPNQSLPGGPQPSGFGESLREAG